MKQAVKNVTGQLSSFWGGSKPKQKAAPAVIKRRVPSPADLAIAKYSGEPSVVARHAAWGTGRVWPKDTGFEQKIPSLFNLSADKIIGVLGCGSGGSLIELSKHLPTFIHGYDWRTEVEDPAEELIKLSGKAAKVRVRGMSLETVFPPDVRCHGIVALEPVLTRAQPNALDWLRLSLVAGGQAVLEEPSIEVVGAGKKISWFNDVEVEKCCWQSLGERKSALKQAGFAIHRVQETTGSCLRSLRKSLEVAQKNQQDLEEAINFAPILEPVCEFFMSEVNSAKNRLHALEVGDVAVYRYRVIKQRADG